jgi:hypothetical protein
MPACERISIRPLNQFGEEVRAYQMTMDEWIAFQYRDFYDVPRAMVFGWQGSTYLLDCRFDGAMDDYPCRFEVYRLLSEAGAQLDEGSWAGLHEQGELIGTIETSQIVLDETRRNLIHSSVFRHIRPPNR